ncbi:MAG: iron ABC transporter permease [Thermomicrobiales bacterium]
MAVYDLNVDPRPDKPGHRTFRTRHFDLRINHRVWLMTAITAVLLVVLTIWATTLGTLRIPFFDVVRAVFGSGTEDTDFVVNTLRLPRVLSAVLVGAALAMSGAIFQGLVRNALVSPDIIGINSGATLVATIWLVFGYQYSLLPIAAFLGALITAGIIYGLAWSGGVSPNRMILVGIGVQAILAAMTTYVTVKFPVEVIRPAVVWTMGSVYGSQWQDVQILGLSLLILFPLAIILMWPLRAMQLGDDVSRALGLPLETIRLGLIIIGCAMAALCVSVAGPIGFVALMVPHVARMLGGPISGSSIAFSAFLGATFLLAADVVAQHFLPVSLPVGLVTAAVGAPYFLFLLYRSIVRM